MSIPVVFLILAVFVALFVVYCVRSAVIQPHATLEKRLREFNDDVEKLEKAIAVLNKLANDYHHSLSASGYPELCSIVATLRGFHDLAMGFIAHGEGGRAGEVLDLVRNQRKPSELSTRVMREVAESYDIVCNWNRRSRDLVLGIVEEINEASLNFSAIGRVRASERTETRELLGSLIHVIKDLPVLPSESAPAASPN